MRMYDFLRLSTFFSLSGCPIAAMHKAKRTSPAGKSSSQEIRPQFRRLMPTYPSQISPHNLTDALLEKGSFNMEKNPFSMQEGPYNMEKNPFRIEKGPYNLDKNPFGVEKGPYSLEKNPFGSEKGPYNLDKNPFGVEKGPYNLEKNPFGVEKGPYNLERSLFSMTKGPYSFGDMSTANDGLLSIAYGGPGSQLGLMTSLMDSEHKVGFFRGFFQSATRTLERIFLVFWEFPVLFWRFIFSSRSEV